MRSSFFLCTVGFLIHALTFSTLGEEKNGLRVEVTKKTLHNAGGKPGVFGQTVDRTMAIKVTIKNISLSKDLPEGKISSVVLIESWLSESGSLTRHTKEVKLEPLRTSREVEVLVGEYHIGGHMHGSSEMHVDHLAGWKIVIEHPGMKTEFLSSPAFESLNQRAGNDSPKRRR